MAPGQQYPRERHQDRRLLEALAPSFASATLPARMRTATLATARIITAVIMICLAIGFVGWSLSHWTLEDTSAYLGAAERILAGEELYPPTDPDPANVYRAAPWFAFVWIPFAYLPRWMVEVAWTCVLLAATAWCVQPLVRERRLAGLLLAAVGGALIFWTASRGNAHPLVMAALIHGAHRRSGPIWIALAASLKAVPILFVLHDLAHRRWRRAAVALGLTALLVAPMPFFGWDPSRTGAGTSLSLYYQVGPTAWLLAAAITVPVAVTIGLLRPRLAWLAAAVAALVTLPRLIFYDFSYLMVGTHPGATEHAGADATRQPSSMTAAMVPPDPS